MRADSQSTAQNKGFRLCRTSEHLTPSWSARMTAVIKIRNSLRSFLRTDRAERNRRFRLIRDSGAVDLLKAEKWFEPDSQNNIAQKFLELLDKDQEWVYVQLHLRGHS